MSPKAHLVKMPSKSERTEYPRIPFLGKLKFSYSKNLFFLRLILDSVMIALVALMLSPLFLGVSLNWTIGILALFIIYLMFSAVSPFLTSHTLTPEELILRQGWYFRAAIPVEEIESVEETNEFVYTGVKFTVLDQKLYVTGSRHGLVRITLKEQRRFFLALGKLAKEIIIDLQDSTRFIDLANELLEARQPIIPASPDL